MNRALANFKKSMNIKEKWPEVRPEHAEADMDTILEWCSGRTTVKALDTLLTWHGLSKNQTSKLQKARVLWNSFRSAVA